MSRRCGVVGLAVALAGGCGEDHWSLTDNFEWIEGYVPRFGLYRVDRTSYARVPTLGADVLRAIAQTRTVTAEQRATYGGLGRMTPDSLETNKLCAKAAEP